MPVTRLAPQPARSPAGPAAIAEMSERIAACLAGVPDDQRETALDAYRSVSLTLLLRRGLPPGMAARQVDGTVERIRARIAAVTAAGGGTAGNA